MASPEASSSGNTEDLRIEDLFHQKRNEDTIAKIFSIIYAPVGEIFFKFFDTFQKVKVLKNQNFRFNYSFNSCFPRFPHIYCCMSTQKICCFENAHSSNYVLNSRNCR